MLLKLHIQVSLGGDLEESRFSFESEAEISSSCSFLFNTPCSPLTLFCDLSKEISAPEQVYLIRESAGVYKIGTANNVPRRLKQLQTGNSQQLVCLTTCPGGKKVEDEFHQNFKSNRCRGEFFSLDKEALRRVVWEFYTRRQNYQMTKEGEQTKVAVTTSSLPGEPAPAKASGDLDFLSLGSPAVQSRNITEDLMSIDFGVSSSLEVLKPTNPGFSNLLSPEVLKVSDYNSTNSSSLVVSMTSSPNVSMTSSPNVSMISSPNVSMTSSHNVSMTSSPNVSMTSSPNVSTTNSPNVSMTSSPSIPKVSMTSIPNVSSAQINSTVFSSTKSLDEKKFKTLLLISHVHSGEVEEVNKTLKEGADPNAAEYSGKRERKIIGVVIDRIVSTPPGNDNVKNWKMLNLLLDAGGRVLKKDREKLSDYIHPKRKDEVILEKIDIENISFTLGCIDSNRKTGDFFDPTISVGFKSPKISRLGAKTETGSIDNLKQRNVFFRLLDQQVSGPHTWYFMIPLFISSLSVETDQKSFVESYIPLHRIVQQSGRIIKNWSLYYLYLRWVGIESDRGKIVSGRSHFDQERFYQEWEKYGSCIKTVNPSFLAEVRNFSSLGEEVGHFCNKTLTSNLNLKVPDIFELSWLQRVYKVDFYKKGRFSVRDVITSKRFLFYTYFFYKSLRRMVLSEETRKEISLNEEMEVIVNERLWYVFLDYLHFQSKFSDSSSFQDYSDWLSIMRNVSWFCT